MATETIETKQELEEAPAEEHRYKYILKGETFYYTREELKEQYGKRYAANGYPMSNEELEEYIDRLIGFLLEYDGDPVGHTTGEMHELLHDFIAKGQVFMFH